VLTTRILFTGVLVGLNGPDSSFPIEPEDLERSGQRAARSAVRFILLLGERLAQSRELVAFGVSKPAVRARDASLASETKLILSRPPSERLDSDAFALKP
jgi:hypothetical protein